MQADNSTLSRRLQQSLLSYYRCLPEDLADFTVLEDLHSRSGFFRFGTDAICFGQTTPDHPPAALPSDRLHDAAGDTRAGESKVAFSFDPEQVIENLRRERYCPALPWIENRDKKSFIRSLYYWIRPLLGGGVRKHLQRLYLSRWREITFPHWPVDTTVDDVFERVLALSMRACGHDRQPFVWFWPEGAAACSILTHDVESTAGLDFIHKLMDLNDSYGIKSSFQVVPEKRYTVSSSLIQSIQAQGFEVNVHDLDHDGNLWNERTEFLRRVKRINDYGRSFGAEGFRSAIMYRKPDWFDALDFAYDMSIPNVAHLDPQRGGCCTIMPYKIGGLIELPLTTTQDYTIFQILEDNSTALWEKQMETIYARNGLISFIVHPDYILSQSARVTYEKLLALIVEWRENRGLWMALPRQLAEWWRIRDGLTVSRSEAGWRITGEGAERARLAWAVRDGERVRYELAPPPKT